MCKSMEMLCFICQICGSNSLLVEKYQDILTWSTVWFSNSSESLIWREILSQSPMHKSICSDLKRKAGKVNPTWPGSTLGLLWEALQKPRWDAALPQVAWMLPSLKLLAVPHPRYSLSSCFFLSYQQSLSDIIGFICLLSVSFETVRGVRAGVLSAGSLLYPTTQAELGTQ